MGHNLQLIMRIFKIVTLLAVAAGSLTITSCGGCCTGEEEVPPLRPLPNFNGVNPGQVNYSK